ncbi:hypothetical protein NIES4073_44410 [Kalymmatonema gypsitolerans NIES-4073]|nr:hypothetical protein NIES4073_44410 [Scytonema sp. NIES-4073]
MTKSFTGIEFIKALSEGTLQDPIEPIVKEGLVKQDENHPDTVLFTEGVGCHNWLTVSVEAIERVEFLRLMPCKDHQHPFVRLYLKPPSKDNKQSALFASLLDNPAEGQVRATPQLNARNCSDDGLLCYDCFDVNGQCVCNWFYNGYYIGTTDCGSQAVAALRQGSPGFQPPRAMPSPRQVFASGTAFAPAEMPGQAQPSAGNPAGGQVRATPQLNARNCSDDGLLCYDCFDVNGQCVCNWFYNGYYIGTTDCGSQAVAALRQGSPGFQPPRAMPSPRQAFASGTAFAPAEIPGQAQPSTVQRCFYGPTALFDCQGAGITGVLLRRWARFSCENRPMFGCSSGGIALVTQ